MQPPTSHHIIKKKQNYLICCICCQLTTCFESIMKMVENILKSSVDIKDFKWLTANSLQVMFCA